MKAKRDAVSTRTRRTTGRREPSRRGSSGPERIDDAALGEVAGGRDSASGQASGKRQWAPVKFVKEWGST
jgi:hypothetical protein